jgi:hypothetical protein
MADSASPDRPQEDLDKALRDVMEFLAISVMAEGEWNAMRAPLMRVIVALLVSQEAQDLLSPYRGHLLDILRAAGTAERGQAGTSG